MPFKVEVGPPQIAIHHGQTVLVTDLDAQIRWPSERGLFFFDTRVLSSWRIYANGVPWDLLNGGATSYYTSHVYLTNGAILTEDGAIPPRTLGLVVSRSIGGGMHEDFDITNKQHEVGALPARDCTALRLCRHFRGQIGQHRAPWAHYD
jgi:N-terminal domain of (some) glycogen debranching enzymes